MSDSVPFELEALSGAMNYQEWVADTVRPFLGERILEIGAGVGNLSRWLPHRKRLILTETEPYLLELLQRRAAAGGDSDEVSIERFDLISDSPDRFVAENLDTIVSFNVLEHIEDDRRALKNLLSILSASKAKGPRRLVTFVPAHQWAFGSMDKQFGHFRRYNAARVRALVRETSPDARIRECRFFNLVGLAGWVLQGRIFRRSQIGVGSIRAFERIIPLIRGVDDFLHRVLRLPLGQSLFFVIEL
ncbi:MAG: class I SAM-dependent methyltransferase [Bdellovibrionota bacterium]